jgi:hypothetical protein
MYAPGSTKTIPYIGHRHFWQRVMARRQFMQVGAGATALAMGAELGLASPAFAESTGSTDPNPIPGGILLGQIVGFPNDTNIYHVYPPAFGQEVSTITDFKGIVAAAEVQGSGTGTNTSTRVNTTLYFDADMRSMQGIYIGMDGRAHQQTLGFI